MDTLFSIQSLTKSPDAKKRKPDEDAQSNTNGSNAERRQKESQPKEKWTTVRKKKRPNRRRKGRAIRSRASAIIIEKKVDNMSYADILRAVRTNDKFKDLSENVITMRPTQKGGLVIELKKGEDAEKIAAARLLKTH